MPELIFTLISNMFSSLIGLLTYLATGYGLYCMAGSVGIKNNWLAWLPFAQDYTLGAVADEYCKHNENRNTTYRKKLLGLMIALAVLASIVVVVVVAVFAVLIVSGVLSEAYTADTIMNDFHVDFAPPEDSVAFLILGVILFFMLIALTVIIIVYTVFRYIALHKIYKLFAPESATLFLVLSIFIPWATPILFFALAKRSPVFTDQDAFFGVETDTWDYHI